MAESAGAIAVAMLYARLRGNSRGLPVCALPMRSDTPFPAIGFNVLSAGGPTREVGGTDLIAHLNATVVAIGAQNVDDLEPLRAVVAEIGENLRSCSALPGNRFGGGVVLSSVRGMDICRLVRDPQGAGQWMLGHVWELRVQPDASY